MNRWCSSTVLLLLAAAAHGHHIWIVPEQPPGPKAKAIFSDYLIPDKPALLAKIAHTKLWGRDRSGKEVPVTWRKGDDAFLLDVPADGAWTVGGMCIYGVETHDHRLRRKVEPYLLTYYAKAILSSASAKPWDKLALDIMPSVAGDEIELRVLFRGKPAANAEMRVHAPDQDRAEFDTDENGVLKISCKTPGVYGFQTRFIETKAGEYEGKKYVEVRHHATLVLAIGTKAGAEKK